MREYDETDRILEAMGIPSPSRMMNYITDSWRKEQESKPINLNTTISAGLNKYRMHWIDGVAKALGISTKERKKEKIEKIISKLTTQLDDVIEKLPPESREALKMVIKAGGWVRYNQLSKKFGGEEEDSYFWESEPPASTIGSLRLHALLFVGKAGIGGRMYKVAVVPKDIREQLEEMLR
ncbi:MAG: hypothetical protein OIN66_09480 [Candidatus Methanoperedens sp.]|nr:hypothetical protein [Candidatus Methanoperedens sp.]